VFSVLLLTSPLHFSTSVQFDANNPGDWLGLEPWEIALALNLFPSAGIAFLRFIGVLRARLGAAEDKLFATDLLGRSPENGNRHLGTPNHPGMTCW
jgi:hypothetical protein